MCADGIDPYNKEDGTSVTPICFYLYNYPGALRGKKEYILTWGIFESTSNLSELRKQKKVNSKPFLDLLVDELLELWEPGVTVFDIHDGQPFTLRAMLYKTVMDYKGIEDVSRRNGPNAYQACSQCTIHGVHGSETGLHQMIYSELLDRGRHPHEGHI